MKILVCGGAGYIGSHMVQLLGEQGHEAVVLDNLSTGHADAVGEARLLVGDVLDSQLLNTVFSYHGPFDLVMHFCAKSLVGESIEFPEEYFRNNVTGTLCLLDAMRRFEHKRLVFSSTASVYGIPTSDMVKESHTCLPINPYGETKLAIEQALAEYHSKYGIRSLSFRYFNACGAHPEINIGERHDPETHLIPNILTSLLKGGKPFRVFGGDYEAPDGSCVRDFIHVCDIAEAHLAAAEFLEKNDGAYIMNLGNGSGFSVFEVIKAVQNITGHTVDFSVEEGRPGDPPILVADAGLAKNALNWKPGYRSIDSIIETAWRFHQKIRE